MRTVLVLLLISVVSVIPACQGVDKNAITTPGLHPHLAQTPLQETSSDQPWLWGLWEGRISADRSQVEFVPLRSASFTLNVVGFLEQSPCTDCLRVVSKYVVGPHRLDLTIQLAHPFKDLPQYTGFDVRGGIQFPGVTPIRSNPAYPGDEAYDYYSWTSWWRNNESQVLNPDGYMRYFLHHAGKNQWKCEGFIDGKLGGEAVLDEPPPGEDSGVHGYAYAYKNFFTMETRHMFAVSGVDTRTYNLWLRDGEVKFGYVVAAFWEPPVNSPVTDPAVDFPAKANFMGPCKVEVLNVSGPLSESEPIFVTFRAYWALEKVPLDYPACGDVNAIFSNVRASYCGVAYPTSFELIADDPYWCEICLKLKREIPGESYWPKMPPGIYPYYLWFHGSGVIVDGKPLAASSIGFLFEIELLD